jgi:hypothetical protein
MELNDRRVLLQPRKFEGIYYFYRRVLADVQPNSVTFIAALAAREGGMLPLFSFM